MVQRAELRNRLNQQVAEMNTLKSLPLGLSVPNSKSIGKAGQEVCHVLVP
jgi:diaphanous 1